MRKRKKHAKRNMIILFCIIAAYAGAIFYCIVTVVRPAEIIVNPESAEIQMDGVSKIPISATVYDTDGNLMSGQEISFKLIGGSGKVTTILGVTADNGMAMGEYQTGYGEKERVAEVEVTDMTGLNKIVTIKETPNSSTAATVTIDADILNSDILNDGLEITATLLDDNGNPVTNQKLLFKVEQGSIGFFGFKMMSQITDENGKAMMRYLPESAGDVVISVTSEADSSVKQTIEFAI